MEIIKLHSDLLPPVRSTEGAAGYDLFMPEQGDILGSPNKLTGLGFAAKVPAGHVALILPRSSAGVKLGVRLGNTVGVIDSDYEGEWKVNIRSTPGKIVQWDRGERLFQFVVVPIATPELQFVDKFSEASQRGEGGFGSTDAVGYLPVRAPGSLTGFGFIRKRVADMTLAEQGWHKENKERNEKDRRDSAAFLELFNKWFSE